MFSLTEKSLNMNGWMDEYMSVLLRALQNLHGIASKVTDLSIINSSILTNSIAYATRRFNAVFTTALQ